MTRKTAGEAILQTTNGDFINLTGLPYQTVIQGWNSDIFAVNLQDGWYGPTGYKIFASNDEEVVEAFENDPLCEGVRVAFDPTRSVPRGVWEARGPEDVEALVDDLLFMEFRKGPQSTSRLSLFATPTSSRRSALATVLLFSPTGLRGGASRTDPSRVVLRLSANSSVSTSETTAL